MTDASELRPRRFTAAIAAVALCLTAAAALWLLLVGSAGPASAQPKPPMVRQQYVVDDQADPKERKAIRRELESIGGLPEAQWRDRATCWGFVDYGDGEVVVSSDDPSFFDLAEVATRKEAGRPTAEAPLKLVTRARPKSLTLTLPERAGGQVLECDVKGVDRATVGVFLARNLYHCLVRPTAAPAADSAAPPSGGSSGGR
ncbi:MAG: hypothetical protein AAGN66_14710 [Acidobacteriota bacterium]